jgi:hypothetical protein
MYYRNQTTFTIETPAYDFEPKGKLKWLQRFMWNMLFKMEAIQQHYDTKTEVKKVLIDRGSVADNLLKSYRSWFNYGKKPTRVYMGHEQFEELSYNHLEHHLVGFNFTVPMSYNRTVFDLPIEVLPNMNGVLIV